MTPEDEQWRRDEARKAADEAETKPIRQLVEDIHYESITGDEKTTVPLVRTTARFACLLYRLSIESEKQTRKVINLTRRLKWLTVALVVLTAALLGFTIYLAQDAYFNRKRNETEQRNRTKPNQPNPEIQLTVPYKRTHFKPVKGVVENHGGRAWRYP